MNKLIFVLVIMVLFPRLLLATECDVNIKEDVAHIYIEIEKILDKESEYRQNQLVELTDTRGNRVKNFYNQCLSKAVNATSIVELSAAQLKELFNVVNVVHFYVGEKEQVSLAKKIVGELVAREGVQQVAPRIFELSEMMIQSRLFDEYRKLKQYYQELSLSPLPKISKLDKNALGGRVTLQVTDEGVNITSHRFPEGGYVVIIGHPLCHFSKNARQDIASDPVLKNILQLKSTWLIPPDRRLYLAETLKANEEIDLNPFAHVYSTSDWPEIGYWGTPTFYFYYNGQLEHQLVGWPGKDNITELKKGLAKIGLLER